MTKLIIDRIEGDYAVCENDDKTFIDIPLSDLPDGVKEGDILVIDENGGYTIDARAKEERLTEIRKKMNRLWK